MSSTIRNEADQALTLGGQQRLLDITTFNTWIEARNEGLDDLAALYERRFSPEFKVAFDAWIALDPFSNPDAPPGPSFMPEYENHLLDEGARLNEVSSRTFDEGTEARHQADEYIRTTVVLASVLFLLALSQRFLIRRVRIAVVVLAAGPDGLRPRHDPGLRAPLTRCWPRTLLDGGIRTHSRWVRYRRAPTLDPLERLQQVQRVSDATLAHLSIDDLLDELLNRVREILDTDTAAVLLLDEARNELVARAAKGIEEEVERGVRIPVGKGFAGRIAAERKPVVLHRVDHSTVMNPILFQKGIRSLLGVPLLAQGEVVGVMHVGTKTRRRFTRDDTELLQLVADRVALALRVRLSDRSRVLIEAFQRTFLPEVLPFLPGLRVATRYLPAATAVGVGRRLVRHVRPARGRHRPRDRRRGGPRPAGGIADGQDAQRPPRARADGRDGPRHPPAGR